MLPLVNVDFQFYSIGLQIADKYLIRNRMHEIYVRIDK